ncbi:amino acid adenylation domain-containing protein [Frankia tisae]|uniref:amino acid adenylation domain-containing protein n=1 Tax=Frankia tisae TaxID=2950104 RepID=UPI0021C00CC4|nr:amino acid adenylation domain-containing protein [Frankia tisae]
MDHPPQRATVPWGVRRIHEHVLRCPSAPAVVDAPDRQPTTYGQLWEQAVRTAAALRAAGTAPGDLVALAATRGTPFVAAALGCWLAQAAYLPLDTAYPVARLRQITDDSRPVVLLSDAAHEGFGADLGVGELGPAELARPTRRHLTRHAPAGPGPAAATAPPATDPHSPATVIYTSGTTGRPKGVEVAHDSLNAFVRWWLRAFQLSADDRHLHTLGLAFDAAAAEIWTTLAAGATLQACPDDIRMVPGRIAEALRRWESTITDLSTPLAEQLLAGRHELPRLRYLLTGGAELRLPVAAPAQPRLVNLYGPTETTVVATFHHVRDGAAGDRPPIGRAIAGTLLAVLADDGSPVAGAEAGELYIGGAGVALGYRHDPELTATRFVTRPGEPGRWYRTGDLVHAEDGMLHYHGRRDAEQLKVRGIRVEAPDVEGALMTVPGIEAAAVTVVGHGADADLVALAVAGPGHRDLGRIRAALSQRLPAGVIPSRYRFVDALPLTANGKLDRPAVAVLAGRDDPASAGAPAPPALANAGLWADPIAEW